MSHHILIRSTAFLLVAILLCTLSSQANASWTYGPTLNLPRSHSGAATDPCGNVYAVGGYLGQNQTTDTVELYDGVSWSLIAPLNTPRSQPAVACSGGYVYAVGGTDATNTFLTSVERLDTTQSSPTWEMLPSSQWLNEPTFTATATVDRFGRIYVIGGGDPTGSQYGVAKVERYDPARPELGWIMLPLLNEARRQAGAAVDHQGCVYAVGGGGGTGGTHLSSMERFDPCNPGMGWQYVASIDVGDGQVSNSDYAVTASDGRIYVIGGWMPGNSARVVRYDPGTDSWEPWNSLGQTNNNVGLASLNDGRIIVIGGDTSSGSAYDSTEISSIPIPPCSSDANADGIVDVNDISFVLFRLGNLCP